MDSKKRHELKKMYDEQIEECKGYAAISAIASGAFLVASGVMAGYEYLNNTKEVLGAAIMCGLFSATCAVISVLALGAVKVVSKRRAKLFDGEGKMDLATSLGKEKGENTKDYIDHVNKTTKER